MFGTLDRVPTIDNASTEGVPGQICLCLPSTWHFSILSYLGHHKCRLHAHVLMVHMGNTEWKA